MPNDKFFKQHPPFPNNLPTLHLPLLSYGKLFSNDVTESQALWNAATDHGFFLLDLGDAKGGPQLLEDIGTVFGIGREFFDLPIDEKKSFKMQPGSIGYKPLGAMKLADGTTDLTEICAVSRDSIFDTSIEIPAPYAKERPFLSSIVERLHPISHKLLECLAEKLGVSADTFHRMHDRSKESATVLRFIHNPPQPEGPQRQASLLGHTDSGSITILFSALGGLQILPADLADVPENWQWVKPQPNCAIINLGDPIVQWTGGVLRSSYHRVLYAPGAQSSSDRYSFGYFLKPHNEAPMRRFQEGPVIATLTPEEKQHEAALDGYIQWHKKKTVGIMKGENNVSRGGSSVAAK